MSVVYDKMAIVQLMKGRTAEYPITRPECVVFPDGTTASSRIYDLEDGINVYYLFTHSLTLQLRCLNPQHGFQRLQIFPQEHSLLPH